MTMIKLSLLASASLTLMGTAAHAQDAASNNNAGVMVPSSSRADQTSSVSGEIVVTARRRDELLRDVPLTVNAVSGDTIQELNIERFEDIQAVVPGLALFGGDTGYSSAATMRGAAFQTYSGTSPTVEFYVNEALVQSTFLFQSMFDIGQIEVLRGPQGTLRGRAAPSGSITVTTRRPDLSEFGGYVDGSVTNIGSMSINGALNVPIIRDVLAFRVAGVADESDADEVRSINSSEDPFIKTEGYRASLQFEPTANISANVMYQNIVRDSLTFPQVESLSLIDPTQPASASIIQPGDRLSIYGFPSTLHNKQQILTGQIDWQILGQQISYVGSWSKMDVNNKVYESATDLAAAYPSQDTRQPAYVQGEQETHELRLSSDDRLFGMLDYTVGIFNSTLSSPTDLDQITILALDFPGYPFAAVSPTGVQRRSSKEETSFFGNLTLHLGDSTEISAGVRHINFDTFDYLNINPPPYTSVIVLQDARVSYSPTIYNASISHRVSDNLMIYANTGSSWRPGTALIGVFRPLTPRLEKYTQLRDEKSTSYELGFKASFLDETIRLNFAAFQQDFDGYIYRGNPVNFVDLTAAGAAPSQFNFGANLEARIRGIDADITFNPSRHFNIGASFSYAKGKISDDFVACNDLNGDGIPDSSSSAPTVAQIRAGAGGEEVAECQVDGRTAFAPDWSLTVQSEYSMPVSGSADGFLRGLLTYYPENEGESTNPYDSSASYGLLNVYAGLRSSDRAWELTFFARNLLNTREVLSRGNRELTTTVRPLLPPTFTSVGPAQSISTGYINTQYTPPREFGLNLRYAFGSR